jgi:hypothetical protein
MLANRVVLEALSGIAVRRGSERTGRVPWPTSGAG